MNQNVPRREGLQNIAVNETVEFELSIYNTNKFGKKQFSGFVGDKFMYLPTHQELVNKLEKIPIGSKVKAKRLTQGGPKEACSYDIVVLEGPNGTDPVSIADDDGGADNSSAIMITVTSCLKNNCSAPQMMMILKKEFSDEELKKVGL